MHSVALEVEQAKDTTVNSAIEEVEVQAPFVLITAIDDWCRVHMSRVADGDANGVFVPRDESRLMRVPKSGKLFLYLTAGGTANLVGCRPIDTYTNND